MSEQSIWTWLSRASDAKEVVGAGLLIHLYHVLFPYRNLNKRLKTIESQLNSMALGKTGESSINFNPQINVIQNLDDSRERNEKLTAFRKENGIPECEDED